MPNVKIVAADEGFRPCCHTSAATAGSEPSFAQSELPADFIHDEPAGPFRPVNSRFVRNQLPIRIKKLKMRPIVLDAHFDPSLAAAIQQ